MILAEISSVLTSGDLVLAQTKSTSTISQASKPVRQRNLILDAFPFPIRGSDFCDYFDSLPCRRDMACGAGDFLVALCSSSDFYILRSNESSHMYQGYGATFQLMMVFRRLIPTDGTAEDLGRL